MARVARSNTGERSKHGSKVLERAGYWVLRDAKARLSELVRRARSDGPQHVTVLCGEAGEVNLHQIFGASVHAAPGSSV